MHVVLLITRLVIPIRGPARSSAALHNGLLRASLFGDYAHDPSPCLHPTLDHHVL